MIEQTNDSEAIVSLAKYPQVESASQSEDQNDEAYFNNKSLNENNLFQAFA